MGQSMNENLNVIKSMAREKLLIQRAMSIRVTGKMILGRVMELLSLTMEMSIPGNLVRIIFADSENLRRRADRNIRANGWLPRCTEREQGLTFLAISIQEIGSIMISMERELALRKMNIHTLETGKTIANMEREPITFKMETPTLETFSTDRCTVMEFWCTKTVISTLANSRSDNAMERETSSMLTVTSTKEILRMTK